MADCIFCMLANHEIPTSVVYEDDEMFCFKDADPQAPVHVLLIPKKHIECLDDLKEEDAPLLGRMMLKIQDIAKELELDNGYRVVSNNGEDAFQTVKHLHFHILGKRKMTWPPG